MPETTTKAARKFAAALAQVADHPEILRKYDQRITSTLRAVADDAMALAAGGALSLLQDPAPRPAKKRKK